jgi:hypothetical protein
VFHAIFRPSSKKPPLIILELFEFNPTFDKIIAGSITKKAIFKEVKANCRGFTMDKQITMKIPEEMYRDLREIATKKGDIPLGKLIRRALDDYIRKNKMKGVL